MCVVDQWLLLGLLSCFDIYGAPISVDEKEDEGGKEGGTREGGGRKRRRWRRRGEERGGTRPETRWGVVGSRRLNPHNMPISK
jgi:hypothetical protein